MNNHVFKLMKERDIFAQRLHPELMILALAEVGNKNITFVPRARRKVDLLEMLSDTRPCRGHEGRAQT